MPVDLPPTPATRFYTAGVEPQTSGPNRHIVVAVPGLSGGVDEASAHLFNGPAFGSRWTVHILTTKGRRATTAPLVFALALLRLVALRARGQVDLVHLNVSSRGSALRKLTVALTARLLRIPYVIQLHGGGFPRFYRGLPGAAKAPVRWMFGRAERVLVLGIPFRDLVVGELGVPTGQVTILRNAVPVPDLVPPRPTGPPTILFTGRLGRNKGCYELVEALDRIRHLPWQAVLAGDGEVEAVRARVEGLELGERVTVDGWQPRPVVDRLLAEADVFVLPSHLEALSVSLLEAMANGLCCITTPVGAQGEIVEHGVNGLLVEPGDVDALAERLAAAVTDGDLRAKLGEAAHRAVLRCCSVEAVGAELTDRYEQILRPR